MCIYHLYFLRRKFNTKDDMFRIILRYYQNILTYKYMNKVYLEQLNNKLVELYYQLLPWVV